MKFIGTVLCLQLLWPAYGQQSTIAQLRTQLTEARHDTTRIRLYGELTRLYSRLEIPTDSAYTVAWQGIALARRYKLPAEESKLLLHLGYHYKRSSQHAKAQATYLAGLKLIEEDRATQLRWKLMYYLACVYGDQGMYSRTIQTATTALNIAEELKDNVSVFHTMLLLASAHLDVKNTSASLSFAQKSHKLAKQIVNGQPDQQELVILSQEMLAYFYEINGQFDKQYPYLKQSLDYYIAQHNEMQLPQAVNGVGKNLNDQKRPLDAIRHLNESLRQKWIQSPVSKTYEIYAQAYHQLGQSDTALAYAQKSHKLALKVGHLEQIQSALGTLIRMEESKKLYANALTHQRQLSTINDSLFTLDKATAIAKVETQYRVAQKEQTIDLLQKDAALRQLKLAKNQAELATQHQRQILLALVTLLLAMGIISLYITFRRERITRLLLANQKDDIQDKATQLQQLNTLKDNLFSIIGHDLRSPLAALKVKLVDLANKQMTITPDEPTYVRLLQLTDKVYNTTDNLLSWSLLQRGGMQVWPVHFDISEVAQSAIQLLDSQLNSKQLTLTTHYQSAPVLADERQLEIVVRNLLHNAIKFTPQGGKIHLTTGQQQNRSVLIIQDSGVGMTKEAYAEAVDLHSRSHSADSGTGLGLTICREFMKLNKGELHIESTPGKGTTVTISLRSGTLAG